MPLIDADEAANKIVVLERIVPIDQQKALIGWCRYIVEHCKTVDAEPVQSGHWEWRETWSDETPEYPREFCEDGWACSACGVYLMQYLQSHFHDIPSYAECISDEMPAIERCPCCGAKMDDDITH